MTVFVGEPASPALVNDSRVMLDWMDHVVDTYLEAMFNQLGTSEQNRLAIEDWLLENAQAVVDEGATIFSRDEIATVFKLQLIKQNEGTYGAPGLPGNLDEIMTRLDELTDRTIRRLAADIE